MVTKNDGRNFAGNFVCLQTKTKFIPHIFLEILYDLILLKYCKFVNLGTLGMPGHVHQKHLNQLVEIFDVYYMQKVNLIPPFFLEMLHFNESCNLIGQQYFGHNLRTRVFPDKGFAVTYKFQNYFSFFSLTKLFKNC